MAYFRPLVNIGWVNIHFWRELKERHTSFPIVFVLPEKNNFRYGVREW